MTEIDISILEPAWDDACPDCSAIVETAAEATLALCPVAQKLIDGGVEMEISIVLAHDALVQELNREYRDRDKPTNVLSFAQLDGEDGWEAPTTPGPCALGDLILAYETVARESAEENKPFEHHLTHLVIHGILHLLGYDHIQDNDAEEMESLEIQILKGLDITDPYKIRENDGIMHG
ncbi:MAG: hypothetical protein JWO78_2093 [Micavibrio sp.]|nr:hypothetical protein [Micavibrio sp.]